MKLFIIALLFIWQPPTFADKFAAFDQKLYDFAVAVGTNGDTTATKAAMLSAANDLSGYNVAIELARIPPLQQGCRWACTGQFYYYCINLAANGHEGALCMAEYINCTKLCGYLPF